MSPYLPLIRKETKHLETAEDALVFLTDTNDGLRGAEAEMCGTGMKVQGYISHGASWEAGRPLLPIRASVSEQELKLHTPQGPPPFCRVAFIPLAKTQTGCFSIAGRRSLGSPVAMAGVDVLSGSQVVLTHSIVTLVWFSLCYLSSDTFLCSVPVPHRPGLPGDLHSQIISETDPSSYTFMCVPVVYWLLMEVRI